MKVETYDYIWDEIIKDNIDELYKNLSEEGFRQRFLVQCTSGL